MRWIIFLARLPPRSKEAIVLWVHTHEASSIKSAVIIVQLELAEPIATSRINLPSNALKDGIDRIVLKASVEDLLGEAHKQIPHLWLL